MMAGEETGSNCALHCASAFIFWCNLITATCKDHCSIQWGRETEVLLISIKKERVWRKKNINLSAGDDSVNRALWKTFQVSRSILKSVSFISSAVLMSLLKKKSVILFNFPYISCRHHGKRPLDTISVTCLLIAVEEMTTQVPGCVCKCAKEYSSKFAGDVMGKEWGEGVIFNS